jgi:hypothetical protein
MTASSSSSPKCEKILRQRWPGNTGLHVFVAWLSTLLHPTSGTRAMRLHRAANFLERDFRGVKGCTSTIRAFLVQVDYFRVARHPDTILPKREHRLSKPSRGYTGSPSTMESAAAVGMIRFNRQPAAENNSRNCFSVRSQPPGKISICKSRNLPGEKWLPG